MNHLICIVIVFAITLLSASAHGFFPLKMTVPKLRSNISVEPLTAIRQTVTQRVDNFDPQNEATYEQTYFVIDEFATSDGPIFIQISEMAFDDFGNSLLGDIARRNRGYLYNLEHRFYGSSHPTEDVSLENLRFLTPTQALADLAHFVEFIRGRNVTAGPVIVVGSMYTGALATWFRQKYPHLAMAAWAPSATLHSVVNHSAYKVLGGEAWLELGGLDCFFRLGNGFTEMERMVQTGRVAELTKTFHLCDPIETENDFGIFFASVAEVFSFIAEQSHEYSIPDLCVDMLAPVDPVLGIASLLPNILPEYGCFPLQYDSMLETIRNTDWNAMGNVYLFRQVAYQQCFNYGWHHTSDAFQQPFGTRFPLSYFQQLCRDIFGPLTDNIDVSSARLNVEFGGLWPNVTRVLFTKGTLDPWRDIGLQEQLNEQSPLIVIERASHANDILSIRDSDSDALRAAKELISDTLTTWIAEAREN